VFENRVLRRTFGSRRNEKIAECKKFHNEDLNNLHFLPPIIRMVKSRMMRWTGYAAHMGQKRIAHKILVGAPIGQRPLGRPMHKWEDDIKMILMN
jgi:hypothetical protein